MIQVKWRWREKKKEDGINQNSQPGPNEIPQHFIQQMNALLSFLFLQEPSSPKHPPKVPPLGKDTEVFPTTDKMKKQIKVFGAS